MGKEHKTIFVMIEELLRSGPEKLDTELNQLSGEGWWIANVVAGPSFVVVILERLIGSAAKR